MLLGAGEGASIEVDKELEVDPQFARVKGLKKKSSIQIKGTRRLKPWHVLKSRKRKKVVSHSTTQLSEHVDHVATATIVHGSFLKQPSDVGIPYVPEMISYEDSCQSIPSSSQASYNPQTLKEMPFDATSYSSWAGDSILDDASFMEILTYSGYPTKN
ncbi:hypothetical protein RHGRI_029071 [Rhododendron griersonianum]|uniref:Uncharacterized protein n=1 Tax=Rhododendron griersonianum TaxID=479676 RepID=A0AAV6INI6_9ERIC|nr:hypothetical protein RHGRI_029071 [Rhododendron griersonianum]